MMNDEHSTFNGVAGLMVFMFGAVACIALLIAAADTKTGTELMQKAGNLTGIEPRYLLWALCGLIFAGFVVVPPLLEFGDIDRGGSTLGRIGIIAAPILLALAVLAVLWGPWK